MDPDFIHELFAGFGAVSVRRMFGGAGIVADGLTFAIVFDGVIYLKTDEASRPRFAGEGSAPFVYPLMKKPRPRRKPSSFWRLPERLYDDADELADWARQALAVARRKAEAKPAKRPSRAKKPVIEKAKTKLSTKKAGTKKPRRRRPS